MQILDSLPRHLNGEVWGLRPDSITQAFVRLWEMLAGNMSMSVNVHLVRSRILID